LISISGRDSQEDRVIQEVYFEALKHIDAFGQPFTLNGKQKEQSLGPRLRGGENNFPRRARYIANSPI
jgi:hypothetical protein